MSDIKGLREISNDPFGKLLTALSRKFSAFSSKDTADQVGNPDDIYSDGQDVESAVKYHNFVMSKQFNLTTQYYSAAQPDSDINCRLWLKGDNLGTIVKDTSGMERHGTLYGDPILVDGAPFDYGIFDSTSEFKSIATRFNRPTSDLVNREFIKVPHDTRHRASEGLSGGISFFLRFRMFDLAAQNNWGRTLFQKRDNTGSPPTDGAWLEVSSSGRLVVRIRNTGVEYDGQTATGTIATNTVYDVWVTYAKSGNVIHIYVNNVDKTLTDPGTTSAWSTPGSDIDWYLFKHGGSTDENGYVYGDFYDFMILREWVVTPTEVSRHFTNKWTTANIPFGQVAISNYSASYGPGGSILFDGVNDSMTVADDTTLWSGTLTKFSFAFRFYPTHSTNPPGINLLCIRHNNIAQSWESDIDSSTAGQIWFQLRNSVNSTFIAKAATFTMNAWNHVACVYDNSLGSANIKIYLNGTLGSTTGNLTESLTQTGSLEIGGPSTDFKGYMKDFRFWKSRPLTQTEVTDVKNNAAAAPLPDFWLNMDEMMGNPKDSMSGGVKFASIGQCLWADSP